MRDTCATLETGEILRSGFHGQIAKMTGTSHLTGVPDLKTSLISKPVTLEIREIRVSTVAWEVQPRLNFLSQIQPRLKFLSQIQPRLNFVAIFECTNGGTVRI